MATLPAWNTCYPPTARSYFPLPALNVSSKLHSACNVLSDTLATSESCIQRATQSEMWSVLHESSEKLFREQSWRQPTSGSEHDSRQPILGQSSTQDRLECCENNDSNSDHNSSS